MCVCMCVRVLQLDQPVASPGSNCRKFVFWFGKQTTRNVRTLVDPIQPNPPLIHTHTHHHHHDNHHDHEEDDDTDAHQDEGYGSCSRQHSGLWLRSYGINKRTATKILAVSLYRHANKYEHTDTYRNTDTLTDFEN